MKYLTLASIITFCSAAQSSLDSYSHPEHLAVPRSLINSPCRIPFEGAKFNDSNLETWQTSHARAKKDLFDAFSCLSRHRSINLNDMLKVVKKQILLLATRNESEKDKTAEFDIISLFFPFNYRNAAEATDPDQTLSEFEGPTLLFNKLAELELLTTRCGGNETDSAAFVFLQEIIQQVQEMGNEKKEISFPFLTAQMLKAIRNVTAEIENTIETLRSSTDPSASAENISILEEAVGNISITSGTISRCLRDFSAACRTLVTSISEIENELGDHDFFGDIYTDSFVSEISEILREYRTAVTGICGSITRAYVVDKNVCKQDTLNEMLSNFNCVGSVISLFIAFKPNWAETYLMFNTRYAHSLTHLGMNLLMSVIQLDEEKLNLMNQCLSKENLDFWERSNLREYFDVSEICRVSEDNLFNVLNDRLAQDYDVPIGKVETSFEEVTFKDVSEVFADKPSGIEELNSLTSKLDEDERMLARILTGASLDALLGKVTDYKNRITNLIKLIDSPAGTSAKVGGDAEVSVTGKSADVLENSPDAESLENDKMSISSIILILSFALVLILFVYSIYEPMSRLFK